MKKLPFTIRSFEALQQELFQLPDAALSLEVLNLRTNLISWLEAKFELSNEEREALQEFSLAFMEYMAIKLSNRLALRKAIRFTVVDSQSFLPQK
ncbi:hypothetical protein D9M68_690540 [compost metagenome]